MVYYDVYSEVVWGTVAVKYNIIVDRCILPIQRIAYDTRTALRIGGGGGGCGIGAEMPKGTFFSGYEIIGFFRLTIR